MKTLRPYQSRAIAAVHRAYAQGAKRVCLVMPTGAGKTFTARAIAGDTDPLWLVHRVELQRQAPGRSVTIQALAHSGERPNADLLIADESHHLAPAAGTWHEVASHYPRILGLTATPERGDGSPLGDLFDVMIEGASYSELLATGHLVEAKVYRPREQVEGFAIDPVEAWKQHAGSKQGFAFFSRIEQAEKFAAAVHCDVISSHTSADDRSGIMEGFKAGDIRCIANVYTMTEGVDVPAAEVCMIARSCAHQGTYLQMVGRVLRPYPGKEYATVIDLAGVSHSHGLPTDDREYSLTGKAIKARLEALRVCPMCGLTQASAVRKCECGYEWPSKPAKAVRVWDMPLELIDPSKLSGKERGIARYRAKMHRQNDCERSAEYARLTAVGREKGYKPGWAKIQYKMRYGAWPKN